MLPSKAARGVQWGVLLLLLLFKYPGERGGLLCFQAVRFPSETMNSRLSTRSHCAGSAKCKAMRGYSWEYIMSLNSKELGRIDC